jgi:[ribosomal protein S5]-alanine N-acetyltransferase
VKALETARLFIRIDTLEEYTELFNTHTDAELKTLFGFRSDEELRKQKLKFEKGFRTHRSTCLFFHLIEKENNTVIGGVSFHNWYPDHRRSEIGYDMKSDEYKNKGYMKEAVRAILAYGFNELNLNRIEAIIAPDNIPSQKTVEGAGFVREALLKEHYNDDGVIGDSLIYRLLLSEYKNRIA